MLALWGYGYGGVRKALMVPGRALAAGAVWTSGPAEPILARLSTLEAELMPTPADRAKVDSAEGSRGLWIALAVLVIVGLAGVLLALAMGR